MTQQEEREVMTLKRVLSELADASRMYADVKYERAQGRRRLEAAIKEARELCKEKFVVSALR